jgi:hypothetical protein
MLGVECGVGHRLLGRWCVAVHDVVAPKPVSLNWGSPNGVAITLSDLDTAVATQVAFQVPDLDHDPALLGVACRSGRPLKGGMRL